MSDIIKLLPDSVANQIAAGEVVQRPASVVKELLENSIDAGATDIKLIVKDAGRTLIQVTDNGRGMSENDARMCFERHATSKINQAQDLFSLKTMGFRGEALASIASVARVELKTRTQDNPLATEIIMEGSQLETQQACQAPTGTTIAVKNLFFNTPARRNFLKNDNVEKTHIYNEFIRVALANPHVAFSYYHNNQLSLQSQSGNLGNRIVNLLGNHYKSRLIPIEESTQIANIQGYIVKPEYAKKKRTEQFFFVNNRFIKSPYLNHAVEYAFSELIPDDAYPSFFIFLDIAPEQIDVNVHPTKTEIKFQDEKFLYQVLRATVRRSLGKYNIAPSLDFDKEDAFENVKFDKSKPVRPPVIHINPDYNPFAQTPGTAGSGARQNLNKHANPGQWEKLFPDPHTLKGIPEVQKDLFDDMPPNPQKKIISPEWEDVGSRNHGNKFMQLQGRYILSSIKSGLMIIDRQRAHERILYEKHLKWLNQNKCSSQTLLYPEQIVLQEPDVLLLNEIRKEIATLGFDIRDFGKNSFMVNAVPADLAENENLQQVIESILENFKKNSADITLESRVNLARSLAKSLAVKQDKVMNDQEMNALADDLFSCEMPYQTPSGKPIVNILKLQEIADRFK